MQKVQAPKQKCGVFGRSIPACPSCGHLPPLRAFNSRFALQVQQRKPGRWRIPNIRRHAASADALSDFPAEPELPAEPEASVFPRVKERDPYRRLGVSREASFEEVQDARNFLYESYRHHERSREAIELAFDSILKEKIKARNKFGFRPLKTGRRTDAAADLKISWRQRVTDMLEPSVPGTTIVNEGVIYLLLGLWSAFQSLATDPSLPIASALGYAIYRIFTKRRNRNPEGPFFGNSAIWGALATTVAAFAFAFLFTSTLIKYVPLPPQLDPQASGLFLICSIVGAISMFFK